MIAARIAQRVLSDQVTLCCPDCGEVLRQIRDDDLLRYRCHTGHAFTPAALLAVQSAKIGDTL